MEDKKKIEYYTLAGKLCQKMKNKMKDINIKLSLKEIQDNLDQMLVDIVKTTPNASIAYPFSLSLNNCVGNYRCTDSEQKYYLSTTDIIKYEFGININGYIVSCGDTFTLGGDDKYIDLLHSLKKGVVKMCFTDYIDDEDDEQVQGITGDLIRMYIESKCTKYNCFPMENCTSYEHAINHPRFFDSKYIKLHFTKYYDENDYLAVDPNINYELLENEVYTINITLVPDNLDNVNSQEHTYIKKNDDVLYRLNNNFYNLKLKSSRDFYKTVKNEYNYNVFDFTQYKLNAKHRIGLKECLDNGILDTYPIYYTKDNLPVYHIKFTIMIKKDKCIVF